MSSGLIRFAVASFIAAVPHAALPAAPAMPRALAEDNPATPPATQAPAALARAGQAEALPLQIPRPPLQKRASPASSPRRRAKPPPAKRSICRRGLSLISKARLTRTKSTAQFSASLGLVKRDMDKANLAPAGRPIAVFVESDDTGFKYHAGYPLAAAPEGKSSLSDAVKIGQTPSGKAMRFEHQGAYSRHRRHL